MVPHCQGDMVQLGAQYGGRDREDRELGQATQGPWYGVEFLSYFKKSFSTEETNLLKNFKI